MTRREVEALVLVDDVVHDARNRGRRIAGLPCGRQRRGHHYEVGHDGDIRVLKDGEALGGDGGGCRRNHGARFDERSAIDR